MYTIFQTYSFGLSLRTPSISTQHHHLESPSPTTRHPLPESRPLVDEIFIDLYIYNLYTICSSPFPQNALHSRLIEYMVEYFTIVTRIVLFAFPSKFNRFLRGEIIHPGGFGSPSSISISYTYIYYFLPTPWPQYLWWFKYYIHAQPKLYYTLVVSLYFKL